MAGASAVINPLKFPWVWDSIEIVSVNAHSPGYCVLSGFERKHEFDVKKGKGTKGSTITFTQLPPAEGEIEFFLWDDGTLGTGHDHFAEWAAFVPLLKYDPTRKKIEAIQIWHPALDDLDISSVVCLEIGMLTRTKDLMFSSKCKFLEYTPPPKGSAVGTASGTKKTLKSSVANQAAAIGDAATQALKEALSAPDSQEKEMDKLWKDFNNEGKGASGS